MNPKDAIGSNKVNLGLLPPVALMHQAMAHMDGAGKYGEFNWREQPIQASIYVTAALRHIMLWASGQENASDSGVHHLGHVGGCINILMDAQAHDCLLDDRQKSQATIDLLEKLNVQCKAKSDDRKLCNAIAAEPDYVPATTKPLRMWDQRHSRYQGASLELQAHTANE
jgi:hypothetical protein